MKEKASEVINNPYLTIREFVKKYPMWSESMIRWFVYKNVAQFNQIVVRRVGKARILLSVPNFWKWIELQNQKPQQPTAASSNIQ